MQFASWQQIISNHSQSGSFLSWRTDYQLLLLISPYGEGNQCATDVDWRGSDDVKTAGMEMIENLRMVREPVRNRKRLLMRSNMGV